MNSENSNKSHSPYCSNPNLVVERTEIEGNVYPLTAPEIRLPHSLPSSNSASSVTGRSSIHDSCGDLPITPQSTLSPYAEVFVPRQNISRDIINESLGSGECNATFQGTSYYTTSNENNGSSSVSNRLRINRPNIKTTEEYESYMRSNKIKPMEKLNQAIDTLKSCTANFNAIQGPILELATDVAKDTAFLQVAVRLILNETLGKENFCYNGARLCVLFDTKIPTFHEMVIEQCIKYLHTYKEKNARNARDHDNVRGVINSLGELYFQFITERKLKLEKLTNCSYALFEAMSILIHLEVKKEINIKTVCQTLKLTGYHLQRSNPAAMINLLSDLETAVQNSADDVILRVRNITRLHSTGWGYSEEPPLNDAQMPSHCNSDSSLTDTWEDPNYNAECSDIDDTVYYGPDGKILTAEETSFLYCNCGDTTADSTNVSDVDDEDTLWDPENELGPEIQKAFKEFVQYSKNQFN